MRDRSAFKKSLALLWASSLALTIIGLSGCGSGGGLSGDDQEPDPATVEYPIAYIQRPTPDQSAPQTLEDDLQDPFAFNPGAKLFVRSRADMNAEEINITDALVAANEVNLYDVKDLAVSPDGANLVFAFHKPLIPNADPIDQTSWDIYVYNFRTKVVRPVIPNKNKSEGSDVAPHFLEDSRIVFVSDRQIQTRAQLNSAGSPAYSGLNERNNSGKAGVIHIMNADGSNIDQLSFNQSHDLSPSQMRNGKLVFVRWDNMNGGNEGRMNLYTLNPSGMNLSYLYGYHSHGNPISIQFSKPREMEDGRIVTILRETEVANLGGDLVAIDTARFSDNTQPTWENGSLAGPAQQSLAANTVRTDGTLSPGGQFGAVWPLFDGTGRLLISWSQCRYLDSNSVIRPCTSSTPSNAPQAPLLYGIWTFDPDAQTQRPVVVAREGVIYTDIVAASPAKNVATATDNTPGSNTHDFVDYGNNIATTLATNNTAVLDIRSVYNLDGNVGNFGSVVPLNMIANQVNPANAAYQTRTARFLQIVQGVPLPDEDDEIPAANSQILEVPDFAYGIPQRRYLRHIIGYVPIEADGSVAVQVPANVPITFNILDANARRLPNGGNHQVWWQFRAGEIVRCTGCHSTTSPNTTLTHGRFDSNTPDSNPGTTSNGRFAGVSVNDVNFDGSSSHIGQSMAQVYAFNRQRPRLPSLNVYFADEWATNVGQRNPTLDYRYITDDSARPRQVPVTPVTSESCLESPLTPLVPRWNVSCRIIINYLEHVQPIWDKSRLFDSNGNALGSDMKCSSCHSPADAMGVAQVPMGQLDLTNSASDRDADRVMSHSELFRQDTEQDLVGGVVVDIPDDIINNGDGTVTTIPHNTDPVMSSAGANSPTSRLFFECFDNNASTMCGTTTPHTVQDNAPWHNAHPNLLTKGELRLLSEWLDNGAQYYNDVSKAAAAQ